MKSRKIFCFVYLLIFFSLNYADSFLYNIINLVDEKLLNCRINQCCNDFKFDRFALESDLRREVHGQHLVVDSVVNSLHGHISNPNPSKALVFSFHGWTGSGKNFVSNIIRKNLFKKGVESRHVKQFIATHDFPHSSLIDSYKDTIRHTVRDYIRRCSRAVFVFDEMDKMPIGLMDTIKPYLDHHAVIEGVDYRKSIFILLSNTGGEAINEVAYLNWRNSRPRESLTLKDFEIAITRSAFNEVEGGLWHAALIEGNMISAFIPFLPMERKHVKLCVIDEVARRKINVPNVEDVTNKVADQLLYWPDETQIYSRSGCKRVAQKVDTMIYSNVKSVNVEL